MLCLTVCFSKEKSKKFKSWDVAGRINVPDEVVFVQIVYKPDIFTPLQFKGST